MNFFRDNRALVKSAKMTGIFVIIAAFIYGLFGLLEKTIPLYQIRVETNRLKAQIDRLEQVIAEEPILQQLRYAHIDISDTPLVEGSYLSSVLNDEYGELNLEYQIEAGYSIISTPFIVDEPNQGLTFSSQNAAFLGDRTLNLSDDINLNTIPENQIIFSSLDTSFSFQGFLLDSLSLNFEPGWNLLNTPINSNLSVESLLGEQPNDLDFLYEPQAGDYLLFDSNINPVDLSLAGDEIIFLEPGKSYWIFSDSTVCKRISGKDFLEKILAIE